MLYERKNEFKNLEKYLMLNVFTAANILSNVYIKYLFKIYQLCKTSRICRKKRPSLKVFDLISLLLFFMLRGLQLPTLQIYFFQFLFISLILLLYVAAFYYFFKKGNCIFIFNK